MKKHFVYILFLSFFYGISQEDVRLQVKTDTLQIRIGEQFKFTIEVNQKDAVIFPELENLGSLELITSEKVDTLEQSLSKKYILTGFDSGSFYIPKQELFVNQKAYFTDSILMAVATVAVDTLQQKPFPNKAIAEEPFVFDDIKPYLLWVYLFVGILLLVLTVYLFVKKKEITATKKRVKLIPAFQEAFEKFELLDSKSLLEENQIKEYYIELTEILRVYLGREVNVSTLEATTAELLELINAENEKAKIGISKETIRSIEQFFKHADFVKFAKLRPALHDINQDRSLAAYLVKDLEKVLTPHNQRLQAVALEREKLEKENQPVVSKKISKRTYYFAGIIAILLIAIGMFSYTIFKNNKVVKAMITPKMPQQETTTNLWQVQTFGVPALSLQAPVSISLQNDKVPQQVKSVLADLKEYSYEDSSKKTQIAITALKYTAQVSPDIEQVLQTTVEAMQDNSGIEDFEYERSPVNLANGLQGVSLSGSYKYSGEFIRFQLLGFSSDRNVWQVFTKHLDSDSETAALLETIKQSITIELE
ncbi:MAG: hypothetical protein ACPHXR_02655 [Flavicella sp.]